MGKKTSLLIASLGLWLLVAPMSFGFACSKMWANDCICGFLLIILGFCAIQPIGKKAAILLSALVGLWLQLAPLFFWAPESASYLNDTFVGMIVMILAFSSKELVGQDEGEETPPGWSFNPSSRGPRSVTVFLALIAWFLARYLASYQLGYVHEIKDPFFGDGTVTVISSSLAKGFPISDAGLGAFGYSLEFLLGLIGSAKRWKTMPWVSILFGMMVIPAGMMSLLLIVLQPLIVGAFCGICLFIAVCMLIMILLTIPEMAATVQVLLKAKKNGHFWSVFWKGDLSNPLAPSKPLARNLTSEFGFTLQWNLFLTAILGVWVMLSPSLFGDLHPASDSNYVVGPLLIALSVISFSEIARPLRFVNILLVCGLILSAFVLSGFSRLGFMSNLASGTFMCALCFPKGKQRELYGSKK
jgi:uncharacterized membrane protein